MAGKYGRLPAVRPAGLKDIASYVSLPTPPAQAHYGGFIQAHGGFGMDGNDQFGDCTIAGAAHAIQLWDYEVARPDSVPTEQECTDQYFALTGGGDTGLVEADVLKAWHKGLFNGSSKIAAYAPVNGNDVTSFKQSVAYYGGCYLGVNLPQSAEDQFNAGQPWTVVPGSPIAGGHCIVASGYDSKWVYVVSWGRIVACSWKWFTTYTEESWCIIPEQFLEAGRGPLKAEDLTQLQADLASV